MMRKKVRALRFLPSMRWPSPGTIHAEIAMGTPAVAGFS
jgi:hypothetical protein